MISYESEGKILESYAKEIFEVVGLKIDEIKFYLSPRRSSRIEVRMKPKSSGAYGVEVIYPLRLKGHYSEIFHAIAKEAILRRELLRAFRICNREEIEERAEKALEEVDKRFEVF